MRVWRVGKVDGEEGIASWARALSLISGEAGVDDDDDDDDDGVVAVACCGGGVAGLKEERAGN